MADTVKVWFDAEGDFLEVRFSDAAGYMKETNHDEVFNLEGRRVLVENIPALVCEHCGEATFSRETTEQIRRMVHGAGGNAGRDNLYKFMRHWLASRLARERPSLYRQLPASYALGRPPAARRPLRA